LENEVTVLGVVWIWIKVGKYFLD